jgi:hypothetical protein
VFRQVADGEVDVGFAHRAVVRPRLALAPIYTEHLVLAGNAAWARRLATARQFRDVPILTYDESDYVIGRWIGHHFGRGAPTWWSAGHFEELEEVLALAADGVGVGVAIVPSFLLAGQRGVRAVSWAGRRPTTRCSRSAGSARRRTARSISCSRS